jgi:hypothetical protein
MAAHAIVRPPLGVAVAGSPRQVTRRANVTPEIFFAKQIDNSRLVKLADGKRNREMAHFSIALAIFFLLVMVYAWQHFSSIEYGYKIEAKRAQRDNLVEVNRSLRLEEARLRDPGRIDVLARRMGLVAPDAGQVQRLEPGGSDFDGAILARAAEIAVVSGVQ